MTNTKGITSMTDPYRLDSNKMLWHMDRVLAWQRGERIPPIHIDAGLSKTCNIKCEYCFGRLQGNQYLKEAPAPFPREALMRYMQEAGECGVKSIGFIGEAEPSMNGALAEAIDTGNRYGISMALGTNGVLLDEHHKVMLNDLQWLRFNLSAASRDSYKEIHGADKFDKVVANIMHHVKQRDMYYLKTTIGLQMVLTPNNIDQAVPLAELGRELGVDYLVIKQCSDFREAARWNHAKMFSGSFGSSMLHDAEDQSTDSYKVIVKWDKIDNRGARCYSQCLSGPFLLQTTGDGLVYPCGGAFDREPMKTDWLMGDLKTHGFKEILNSDRYWEVIELVKNRDEKTCLTTCRKHSINEFLHDYTHPPEHLNFV